MIGAGGWQVSRRRLLLANVACQFCLVSLAQGTPQTISEETLRNAIIGEQVFNELQLSQLDLNADARVDVADLAFYLKDSQIPLSGYKWLVTVYSDSGNVGIGSLAHEYTFVLVVDDTSATVGTIDELDPTKGLLRQGTSLPAPGDCPGASRPDYAPTALLPVGTVFSVVANATDFDVSSDPVVIPPSDPTNPLGMTLSRSWALNVSTADVFANEFYHGSITETLNGVLPNGQPIVTTGQVRLTRYALRELVSLDGDTSPPTPCVQ